MEAAAGCTGWTEKNKEERKQRKLFRTARGSLDRLVAIDGRPLIGKEQEDERKRLENLVRNPTEQQKLEQTKRKDAEQCKAFFKMIPDALVFSYAGRDGGLIKLAYRPNPAFQPPSREARVFQEMEGEMWVHEGQRRLVRILGQLTADLKFGAGLLGHLEKGSHFEVEQRELLPGQWELTFMEVKMQGTALFFKTIAVQEKEYRSDSNGSWWLNAGRSRRHVGKASSCGRESMTRCGRATGAVFV